MSRGQAISKPPSSVISYDESKRLVRSKDPQVRESLAQRDDVRPEILFYLAGDPTPEVRRTIANNPQTPAQADLVLAQDKDEAVRRELAAKVARLTPELSQQERKQAEAYVVETLELLARDQAVRVRQILSETLKDATQAPDSVIKALARDAEDAVASPILEFSPLLTDLDLIEIIESGCVSGRLRAISRRQGLGEQVADAIVATDDIAAITDLLENNTAQIREQTLDDLVERAAGVPSWHRPLIGRPKLSSRAALKLSTFVADALLKRLQDRKDLDPETARRVAQEVHRRIVENDHKPDLDETASSGDSPPTPQDDKEIADEALLEALGVGDKAMVRGGLALRSGLQEKTVEKILASASPKAVTALAWKAGLTMRFATQLQLQMGGISPKKVLHARDGTDYPMSGEEMDWQLEFFESLAG